MRLWSCLVLVLAACGEAAAPAEPPAEAAPAVEEAALAEPEVLAEGESDEVEAAVTPSAHELLVLTVGEPALLPSETRLAEFLEARMRRNRRDAELRPATAEEAAFFAGEAERVVPATFGEARRVLFLHFPAPRTLPNGDLRSRGIDRVVLHRLPETEPIFVAGMDEAWRLEDEQWATWIAGLLREGEGS
jgi:hypothetical protein